MSNILRSEDINDNSLCRQGHELTPENTRIDKRGYRRCRACNRERQRRWREDNADAIRKYNRENPDRNRESYAKQIASGVKISSRSSHHGGMDYLLGGIPKDGLTVSRICAPDCTDSYVGYSSRRGKRVKYPLCANPDHYCLETQAENLARGSHTYDQPTNREK
jgi:hypothetical protein